MTTKPFPVPLKKIGGVQIITDSLTTSHHHPHRIQAIGIGNKDGQTQWADWETPGAIANVKGSLQTGTGSVLSLATRPGGGAKAWLTSKSRGSLGLCAAWGKNRKAQSILWPNPTDPGYYFIFEGEPDKRIVPAHQNGPVRLGPKDQMTLYAIPAWDYTHFETQRRANLEKLYTPKSLVDEVIGTKPQVLSWEFEEGQAAALQGYRRANFVLSVSPEHFDQLYNGRAGIRGQHYLDPLFPEAGLRLRRYFISQWLPQFDAFIDKQTGWNTPKGQKMAFHMAQSLMHQRAKIWQVEGADLPGYNDTLTIPRWQSYKNTKTGDKIQDFLELDASYFKSWISLGQHAAYQDRIKLMGHWIDDNGNFAPASALPERKRKRDKQVTYLGFS